MILIDKHKTRKNALSDKEMQLYLPVEGLAIIPENARQGVLHDNSFVQESKELLWTPTEYGELEQKIITLVKAQIKEDDDTLPDVSFSVEDLAKYLNVTKDWIYNYYPNVIADTAKVAYEFPFEIEKELAYGAMPFFSAAVYVKGKFYFKINPLLAPLLLPNVLWQKAGKKVYDNRQYKFEIAKYNATKQIALTGKYTVKLYPLFASQLFKNQPLKISLHQLRNFTSTLDKFKEYKEFNRNVLMPAVKEINEKSDIFIKYDSIKNGNKITDFIFNIFPKPQNSGITKAKELLLAYGISERSIDYIFDTLNISVELVILHVELVEKLVLKGKSFNTSVAGYLYQSIINNYGAKSAKEIALEEKKLQEKQTALSKTALIKEITEQKDIYDQYIKKECEKFIQSNDIEELKEDFYNTSSTFAQKHIRQALKDSKDVPFDEVLRKYSNISGLFNYYIKGKINIEISFLEFLGTKNIEVTQMFLDENLLT